MCGNHQQEAFSRSTLERAKMPPNLCLTSLMSSATVSAYLRATSGLVGSSVKSVNGEGRL